MSYITKPKFQYPGLKTNDVGLSRRDYEGTLTTLCGGCGHDSISAAIIQAAAEMSLEPHKVAKISVLVALQKYLLIFLAKPMALTQYMVVCLQSPPEPILQTRISIMLEYPAMATAPP